MCIQRYSKFKYAFWRGCIEKKIAIKLINRPISKIFCFNIIVSIFTAQNIELSI